MSTRLVVGLVSSVAFGPFSSWKLLRLLRSLPSFDSRPFSVAFRHSVSRNKKGEEGFNLNLVTECRKWNCLTIRHSLHLHTYRGRSYS